MGKRLGLLVGVALAATAATATGAGPPKPFVARYHLSGYGVYHQTHAETWTASQCVAGNTLHGGEDGTLKQVSTIRWETVQPGTAIVTRVLPYLPPTLALIPGKKVEGQRVIAIATITRAVTGNVDFVSCKLDGTADRLGRPVNPECGSHTYTKGYIGGPSWPLKVTGRSGQQFEVGLEGLESARNQWKTDWKLCWGPGANEFGAHLPAQNGQEVTVSGALPLAHLPKRIRGKLTAIARGTSAVDQTGQQGGSEGGKFHSHDTYSATSYITFVRIK